MNIVEEAYKNLFPEDDFSYKGKIKYSGKFSDYNANVKKRGDELEFCLSKTWKGVDRLIVIGLIQSLMIKLFKKGQETISTDLYNSFVKNLHLGINKDNVDPILKQSFERINHFHFDNTVELCNLIWGQNSRRKLGSYDFQKDTIMISKIFLDSDKELLDYVMYHEMLHKKLKFETKSGRNIFHSREFREAEKAYPNSEEIENKIKYLGRPIRMKKTLFNWFG